MSATGKASLLITMVVFVMLVMTMPVAGQSLCCCPTKTPTNTATATNTATSTSTATATSTATSTDTATSTATHTATKTPIISPTPHDDDFVPESSSMMLLIPGVMGLAGYALLMANRFRR